jgi:hypothetical protein
MVDRGLTIYELAERLGLHPLEVAAILGHERPLPKVLVFDDAEARAVESVGAIEWWWTDEPTATEPARTQSRFRRILARLLDATGTVRLDNAIRGLPASEAQALRSAIDELVENDVLRRHDTLRGAMLAIGDRARAEAMRDGQAMPDSIGTRPA